MPHLEGAVGVTGGEDHHGAGDVGLGEGAAIAAKRAKHGVLNGDMVGGGAIFERLGQGVVVMNERIFVNEAGAVAQLQRHTEVADSGDVASHADFEDDGGIELLTGCEGVGGQRRRADRADLLLHGAGQSHIPGKFVGRHTAQHLAHHRQRHTVIERLAHHFVAPLHRFGIPNDAGAGRHAPRL